MSSGGEQQWAWPLIALASFAAAVVIAIVVVQIVVACRRIRARTVAMRRGMFEVSPAPDTTLGQTGNTTTETTRSTDNSTTAAAHQQQANPVINIIQHPQHQPTIITSKERTASTSRSARILVRERQATEDDASHVTNNNDLVDSAITIRRADSIHADT